jgi:hypothetical protein
MRRKGLEDRDTRGSRTGTPGTHDTCGKPVLNGESFKIKRRLGYGSGPPLSASSAFSSTMAIWLCIFVLVPLSPTYM